MPDETLNKVKILSNKKVAGGKNVKDVLSYGDVSLWWFIEHSVYLRLKDAKDRKTIDNEFITSNRFTIAAICIIIKILIVVKILIRCLFGKIASMKQSHKPLKRHGRKKIMVFGSLVHWRAFQDPFTMKTKTGDVILGNIIDALRRKKFEVICIDRDDTHFIDTKRMFGKLFNNTELWTPIESYFKFGMIWHALKEVRHLESRWSEFVEMLATEDKKVSDSLSTDFNIFFVYHTLQAIFYIELSKRILKEENPSLMVVSVEHADTGRTIITAGRLMGIPTLAIQHGFYAHGNVMYSNYRGEVSNRISTQHHPLPDKTAVYGPWIKKIFMKNFNYPKDSVIVTGQPRYDILPKIPELFKKQDFYTRLGIDKTKKTILITTQPIPFDKREVFLKSLLSELKKIEDINIVIKPHPIENKKWHERIVNDVGVDAIVLPSTSNTYEALYACDLMITLSSTTVLEAAILGKDIIIADLIGYPYAEPFMKSRGTIGVKDKNQLLDAIEKILYNKRVGEKLKKGRKKLVYNHAYRQDGKATERFVNLAERMIEKSVGV